MEKIELTLDEILKLKAEIYGTQNQQTGEQLTEGLLKQEIPHSVKYWIHKVGDVASAEETIVNKLRDELILKHGETDENGNTGISISVDAGVETAEDGTEKKLFKVNPKFIEFQQELEAILLQKKEIEYKPFTLADFDKMTTKEDYPTFNKMIVAE
jgi:hypothetical protein